MPVPGVSNDDIQRMVKASEGNLGEYQVEVLLKLRELPTGQYFEGTRELAESLGRRQEKSKDGELRYKKLWHTSIIRLDGLDNPKLIDSEKTSKPHRRRITDEGRQRIEDLARKANVQLSIQSSTTPQASDVDEPPERVEATSYRILRDTKLARDIKAVHNHECQICGHTIKLPDGSCYAEAHHIRPLGQPHDGPDVPGNILCLCPNHHAECDLGAIELSLGSLRHVDRHDVDPSFIGYHNREIFGG